LDASFQENRSDNVWDTFQKVRPDKTSRFLDHYTLRDNSSPEVWNNIMIPPTELFVERMKKLGIGKEDIIIVYMTD